MTTNVSTSSSSSSTTRARAAMSSMSASESSNVNSGSPRVVGVAAMHKPASAEMQASSRRAAAGHGAMAQSRVMHQALLKVGSHGAAVKDLQKRLNHHGAHLATDGSFGPHTEAAVKAFQHANHLSADGVVGPKTQKALHSAHAHNITHTTASGGIPTTVAGCAQELLHSPNVTFWAGLSSGSERANFQRLAAGEKSKVFATNHTGPSSVTPSLHMMQALVDMSRHGSIQINALTGGTHTFNSNHYSGHAVDLSVFGLTQPDRGLGAHHKAQLSLSQMESIAGRHGGVKNFETSHAHFDF